MTGLLDRWYRVAELFSVKQRINELERANKYWPDSPNRPSRDQELYDKRNELINLENGN